MNKDDKIALDIKGLELLIDEGLVEIKQTSEQEVGIAITDKGFERIEANPKLKEAIYKDNLSTAQIALVLLIDWVLHNLKDEQ